MPVDLDGKRVLFFSVHKGTTQIYQLTDGKCVPIAFSDIQFERQEIRSRDYERQFVDGAKVSDLDLDELQISANSYT